MSSSLPTGIVKKAEHKEAAGSRAGARIEVDNTKSKKSTIPPNQSTSKRLFALLIGVDKYKSDKYRNLHGAVKDVEHVETFLLKGWPSISAGRIMKLTNEDATMANIIKSIVGLSLPSEETGVRRGDPILIYYAGHGSTNPKPDGWPTTSTDIQCLAPYDACVEDGLVKNVITDRTLGALLKKLADAKGDNITVILDSCHSGSGSRDLTGIARGIEFASEVDPRVRYTISASYQHEIWNVVDNNSHDGDSMRGIVVPANFAHSGLRSHVLLAACSPDKYAYEDGTFKSGRFTTALLDMLRESGADALTYSELISRMKPLPSEQKPQCEGVHKNTRIIFDAGVVQRNRDCYALVESASSYTLRAGRIFGVRNKDVFAVYQDQKAYTSKATPLGKLVVEFANAVTSSVSPIDGLDPGFLDIAPHAVAVLAHTDSVYEFGVHVDEKFPELRNVVAEALAEDPTLHVASRCRPRLMPSSLGASLQLVPDAEKSVALEILVPDIIALGLTKLSGTVACDATSLRGALRSAAHFFYHLRSSPDEEQKGFSNTVSARVCEVSEEIKYYGKAQMPKRAQLPIPGTIVELGPSTVFRPKLCQPNEDGLYAYGMNVSLLPGAEHDLYVWLFYFDCSTLEIVQHYGPPVATDSGVAAPLRVGTQEPLPLNYGDAGSPPFMFALPDGVKHEAGFLRLFVTTHYTDMSRIVQAQVVQPGVRGSFLLPTRKLTAQGWDAISFPVVLGLQ